MKASQLLLILGVAAGAYWLLTKKSPGLAEKAEADDAPVIHVVEETLHKHAGEDSPMVHAFEEALEKA